MTSRHASEGGRRRVAPWIIVTIVALVAVVGASVVYLLVIRDGGENRAACTGHVVLAVTAAPGAAPAVTAAAAAFDATAPVARSTCVSTDVTVARGAETATNLHNGWSGQPGPAPAVWLPDTEADLANLEAVDSALTAGRNADPMATSPVVLAVRTEDADAVAAAPVNWRELAAATGPDGSVALPQSRHLILALPDPTTNRATSYALQSVLAGTTPGPVDPAVVAGAAAELSTLRDGGPATQPATTEVALTELAAGGAGFTAVPVVESDLKAFSAQHPGLTAVRPAGGTVGDAVYAVPLTAGWVDPTLDDAASVFLAYLRGPAGLAAFTDNGLHVTGHGGTATGPPSGTPAAGQDTAASQATVPDAGAQVAAALAVAIGAKPAG